MSKQAIRSFFWIISSDLRVFFFIRTDVSGRALFSFIPQNGPSPLQSYQSRPLLDDFDPSRNRPPRLAACVCVCVFPLLDTTHTLIFVSYNRHLPPLLPSSQFPL